MDTLDRPLEWNLYKYAYTFQQAQNSCPLLPIAYVAYFFYRKAKAVQQALKGNYGALYLPILVCFIL